MIEFAQKYLARLKDVLDQLDLKQLQSASDLLLEAYRERKLVAIAGNGGSAATASHFVNDLNKGILGHKGERQIERFRALSFNDNIPLITAWSNNVGYERIFVEQVRNYLTKGDLLILISASGNSPNVVLAAEEARARGVKVLTLTGFSGGGLKDLSDCNVLVPVDSYQLSEDVHGVVMHLVVSYLIENLDPNKERKKGNLACKNESVVSRS